MDSGMITWGFKERPHGHSAPYAISREKINTLQMPGFVTIQPISQVYINSRSTSEDSTVCSEYAAHIFTLLLQYTD